MSTNHSNEIRDMQPVDARALQLRLYREIGLSAVAAALECANLPEPREIPLRKRTAATIFDQHRAA